MPFSDWLHSHYLFKKWSVYVEELSADTELPRGSLMFLKQIFAREAKEGKYAIFKNMKFPRSNYQTDISETLILYCFYC